jgi:hypothetical protein
MKSSDLTVVATFRSTVEAQIAQGVLDEGGVTSMVRSDDAGGMYPGMAGAELLVSREDLEAASLALQLGAAEPASD